MSKNCVSIVLTTILASVAFTNAHANPATVSLEGAVNEATCTMTADSMARTVTMNDITKSAILAAPEPVADNHADFYSIPGAETAVPAINFVNCPTSATKVWVSSVSGPGAVGPGEFYWEPQAGSGKGIWLALAGKRNEIGRYLLCSRSPTYFNDCKEESLVYFPVTNGTASTGSDGLKIFAYKQSGVTSDGVVAGPYSTTITVGFDYQ